MGSKGSKPRKPKRSQHQTEHAQHQRNSSQRASAVDPVTAAERMQHEEREAVLDTMGLGSVSPAVKVAIAVVGIALLVAAILILVVLD